MQQVLMQAVIIALILSGCGRKNQKEMKFVEIEVQNHLVSHGFDENNKEIIEKVEVDKPMKKLIRVDRIKSVSEKYILTSYGYGRLVYWEYKSTYDEMKSLLVGENGE